MADETTATYRADLRYARAGWIDGAHAKWACTHRHRTEAQAGRCGIAEIRRLTRATADVNVLTYISFAAVRNVGAR